MTSKVEILSAYYDETWSNPPSSIKEAGDTYLSEDFQNLDRDGNVLLSREAYIGLSQLMAASFEGFKAVYSDLREVDDGVIATFHFEGTHARDLDMSAMGLGVIPASGKKLVWQDASAKFMVEGDKIVGIQDISGGMEWFLAPLGVKPPSG